MPFPYGPLRLNSIPWVVAKQPRFFEKNGLDVDMVYVGASAVIVQSMLSGSANVAGFGGPAVITNVLRGGDIIQVAAMAPYFSQSVVVRSDIRDIKDFQGKKIGITRFGSVTDFALRTLSNITTSRTSTFCKWVVFPRRLRDWHAARLTARFCHRPTALAWSKKVFASWQRRRICAGWAAGL